MTAVMYWQYLRTVVNIRLIGTMEGFDVVLAQLDVPEVLR